MEVSPANLSLFMINKGSPLNDVKKAIALVEKDVSSKGCIFNILDEYNKEFKIRSKESDNKYAFFYFVRYEKNINIPAQEVFDFYENGLHQAEDKILEVINEFVGHIQSKKRLREEENPSNKKKHKYKNNNLMESFETYLYKQGKRETTVQSYKYKVRSILESKKIDSFDKLKKIQISDDDRCTPLTSFYNFCKENKDCTFDPMDDDEDEEESRKDNYDQEDDEDEEDEEDDSDDPEEEEENRNRKDKYYVRETRSNSTNSSTRKKPRFLKSFKN